MKDTSGPPPTKPPAKRALSMASNTSPWPKMRMTRQRSRMEGQTDDTALTNTASQGSSHSSLKAHSGVRSEQIEADAKYAHRLQMQLEEEEDAKLAKELDMKESASRVAADDERPFRLMDLPPELRNGIYRCCLQRPFKIELSKKREPPRKGKAKAKARLPAAASDSEASDYDDGDQFPRHSVRNLPSGTDAAQPRGDRSALSRSRHQSFFGSKASTPPTPRRDRAQDKDPLLVNILRISKLVYKEARSILYSENIFMLDLMTAQHTLTGLHQRSRMQIRQMEVTIPTHTDILERFAEVVRLNLRYCWGLKKFVIHMPFSLPGADGGQIGNATVYANAFDILRWLPQSCEVELSGTVCEEIVQVVDRNAKLRKSLDKVGYARRQLISTDAERALKRARNFRGSERIE